MSNKRKDIMNTPPIGNESQKLKAAWDLETTETTKHMFVLAFKTSNANWELLEAIVCLDVCGGCTPS